MAACAMEQAAAVMPDTDILVNTTPVGMEGTGETGGFPFMDALQPGAPAVDCIYAPARTPFMEAALSFGHPVANGIGMLVYQAICAYGFFRDIEFDEEAVSRLGKLLLCASGVNPEGK